MKKKMLRRAAATVLSAAIVTGALPVDYSAPGKTAGVITAAAADQISEGKIYLLGDTIDSGDVRCIVDDQKSTISTIGKFKLGTPQYDASNNQWIFTAESEALKLTGDASEIPDGIICTGGSGDQDDPYAFEVYFRSAVTFDANGGTGSMDKVWLEEDVFTFPECGFTAPEGYEFDHWELGGKSYQVDGAVTVSGTEIAKACWREVAEEPAVISFDATGGSGEMSPETLPAGTDKYILPECTFTAPDGCVFAGWEAGSSVKQPGEEIDISGSVTVRAVWNELRVVSFDATGGSGVMSPVTLPAGKDKYILPKCTFTAPDGCVFAGWEAGTSVRQPGEEIDISGSVTVRALWNELYVVSFDANGGEGEMSPVTLSAGTDKYTLPECTFTAPEYCVFDHWSYNGTDYAPEDEITLTGSATISAEWRELPVVIYESGLHGTGAMDTVVLDDATDEYELPDFGFEPDEGYMFEYWYVDGYGALTPGDIIEIDGITRVIACWTEGTIVRFNANGGTGTMPAVYRPRGEYVLPECRFTAPEHMRFKCWSWPDLDKPGVEYTGNVGQPINLGKRTTVLSPKWEELPAITFDPAAGTGEMEKLYADETTMKCTLPECEFTPPEGYLFDYWYSNDFGSKKPGDSVTLNRAVTVKAVWKQQKIAYFSANGGTGEMAPMYPDDTTRKLTLPDCEFTPPEGFVFDHWYSDAFGSGKPGDTVTVNYTISTIKPEWKELAFVQFDANGGSGSMDVWKGYKGDEYTLPQCTLEPPARTTFRTWLIEDNKNPGVFYEHKPSTTITLGGGTTVLKADWIDFATVVFDPAEGSGTMENIELDGVVQTCSLPECTFEAPEGMVFVGWEFDGSLGLQPGNTINAGSGENVVTAMWRRRPVVSFSPGTQGTGTMDDVVLRTDPAKYYLPVCTFGHPDDYRFDGWFFGNYTYLPDQYIDVDSGTHIVTALWKKLNVITFDANGGSGSMDKEYLETSVSTYKLPECSFTPPEKKEFDKWELVTADSSSFFAPGQTVSVSDNFTLKAVWKDIAPSFTTNSMILEGSIILTFAVDMGSMEKDYYDLAYVEFNVNGTTQKAYWKDSIKKSDNEYKFKCRLNSISMADDVTAVLHYFDADGTEKTVTTVRNAESYLEKFNDSYSEVLWSLIKSINDFGYYMQRYLDLHSVGEWTLGVDHTAMKKAYVSAAEFEAKKEHYLDELGSMQKEEDIVSADIDRINFSLVLDSDTAINVKIAPNASYTAKPRVTVNGKSAAVSKIDGRWQVTIPDIPAHRLGEKFTVKITTTHGTSTFVVSAMTYAYLAMQSNTDTETFNAMCALYEYWKATVAYNKAVNNR